MGIQCVTTNRSCS